MIWGKTKSKHNPRQSLDEKSKPKPSAFSRVPEGFYVGKVLCGVISNSLLLMSYSIMTLGKDVFL